MRRHRLMHIHHQGRIQTTRPETYKVRQGVEKCQVEAGSLWKQQLTKLSQESATGFPKGLCKDLEVEEP